MGRDSDLDTVVAIQPPLVLPCAPRLLRQSKGWSVAAFYNLLNGWGEVQAKFSFWFRKSRGTMQDFTTKDVSLQINKRETHPRLILGMSFS